MQYTICLEADPTICDTATVLVVIAECADFPTNDCDDDGVINALDICEGFDDNADADGNLVPDGCDLYDNQVSIAKERMNFYLIASYVFDLSEKITFKPAALVKAVSGAPIIADVSANFLFNDKFTLGVAYRWDDSVSGLAGIQVTDGLYIGYSYDATTTNLNNYNSGLHEIMLCFEL